MLNSCGPRGSEYKKEQKGGNCNWHVLNRHFTFQRWNQFYLQNGRPAQLNTEDILAIEHILSESIDKYNSEQEGEMKRIAENYKTLR